jgi:hypothetical protein
MDQEGRGMYNITNTNNNNNNRRIIMDQEGRAYGPHNTINNNFISLMAAEGNTCRPIVVVSPYHS